MVAYGELGDRQLLKESNVEKDARDVFLQQLLYLATGDRTATVIDELRGMKSLLRIGRNHIGEAASGVIQKRISQLKKLQLKAFPWRQPEASSHAAAPCTHLKYAKKRMIWRRVGGKKVLR